jgi:REP element-mobilizing transposase RayT
MPNTFSQIDLHLVFAVKNRKALILTKFREQLFKYICGIIINKQQKLFAINGVSDHVHIFFGMDPVIHIPEFVKVIKAESTNFINENKFLNTKFQWQKGYGIFSHSRSNRDRVIKYILNQESHHQKQSFKDEFLLFLKITDIEFNEKYLFDFFELSCK